MTDTGLPALAELPDLERLDLDDTAVGDDGLRHLAVLGRLQRVYLNGSRVTDAGVERLRSERLDLDVRR